MSEMAPFRHIVHAHVGADAAGDSATNVVCAAPFAGTITAVELIPAAAVTGHASNNRTFALVNKGAAGSGSTSVATITTNASNSLTASDAKALTLSGTAANKAVAEGDVIVLTSTANASGVAHSGGVVAVTFERE